MLVFYYKQSNANVVILEGNENNPDWKK